MAGIAPDPAACAPPLPGDARTTHRATPLAHLVDRHPVLSAFVVAAASVAVKYPGIARRSVWLDEAWTVALAAKAPAAIVFVAAHDHNPPLYNLLMAGWLGLFGNGEVALRVPSLLAAAGCAVVLLLFARRFYGAEAAVYASLLLLVSAAQTYYATEGRAYALVGLLCLASFHLYLSVLERPRWATAIALAVVNAAALYTHYTIGLAWVAQGLCALAFAATGADRRALRLYVASQLLALALFAPFVSFLLARLPRAGQFWLPVADLSMLYGVVRQLAGSRSALRAGLVLTAGFLLWRAARWRRGDPRGPTIADLRLLVAVTWAVVPILLAFVVSQRSPILHARYELFAGLGWIVALAAVLSALPWPGWARTGAALLLVFLSAKGSPNAATRDPAWRNVARIARPAADDPSTVVVMPPVDCIPFAYYAAPDLLPSLFGPHGAYNVLGMQKELAARRILCRDRTWPGSDPALDAARIVLVIGRRAAGDTGRILRDTAARGWTIGTRQSVGGKAIYVLTRDRR